GRQVIFTLLIAIFSYKRLYCDIQTSYVRVFCLMLLTGELVSTSSLRTYFYLLKKTVRNSSCSEQSAVIYKPRKLETEQKGKLSDTKPNKGRLAILLPWVLHWRKSKKLWRTFPSSPLS